MSKIIAINDLLKNELKEYYEYLKSKLGYIGTIEDLLLCDDELIDDELDGDSELIYSQLNDYINLNYDQDFDIQVNIDRARSTHLKLLIIVNVFEYGLYNYDMLTMEEKKIIDNLSKSPTPITGLKVYEKNYLVILNLYSSLFLDNVNYEIENDRQHVIDDNRLDVITSICPYEILDYRFLLGYKFEDEDINSIKLGKDIINVFEEAKRLNNDKHFHQIKQAISIVIDEQPDKSSFIENNQNYIICNIYEHLLLKKHLNRNEQEYVEIIETKGVEGLLQLLFKNDDSLEILINMFYYYNRTNLSEDYLFRLRSNTKKKGKIKIIEKNNPYYYEETSYFKNQYK